MNNIPDRQNSAHAIWLLRGRQQTYAYATQLQVLQFIAIVIAPMICAVISLFVPHLRAGLATVSLTLLLLDITLLDRVQASLLRRAAKIAEQFDCEVLEMRWNDFVAENKADPEDIENAATNYPTGMLDKLQNWYPPVVGRAPAHVARIACQLTNLRYDATLRKRYAGLVASLPVIAAIAVVIAALVSGLPFEAVVLSVLVPATPIIVWALREFFRHSDTARKQEAVKQAAEQLWQKARDCSEGDCEQRAREFQDAIYQRRVTSPLIFPLVYHMFRDAMEREMNVGAEERLQAIGY